MINARFVRALAAVALFNGALYLVVCQEVLAADKEAEAKKYAEELKRSKDAKVRATALQELGKLAAVQKSLVEEALPDIYKSLEDKDAGVRGAAAFCLGQCDEPTDKAVPLLTKILKEDKDDKAKIGAAKGLASIGPAAKSAVPALKELAADKKSPVGQAAKTALKAINAKKQ